MNITFSIKYGVIRDWVKFLDYPKKQPVHVTPFTKRGENINPPKNFIFNTNKYIEFKKQILIFIKRNDLIGLMNFLKPLGKKKALYLLNLVYLDLINRPEYKDKMYRLFNL